MADNINWPPTLGGAWYLWDNRLGGVPRPARPGRLFDTESPQGEAM